MSSRLLELACVIGFPLARVATATGPGCEPTPDEIAAACSEIRDGWSPETELSRRARGRRVGFRLVGWE